MLKNVHKDLASPGEIFRTVAGDYYYYHYGCDDTNDRGWGCGYRTLQSICSWVIHQKRVLGSEDQEADDTSAIHCFAQTAPSIREIQKAIVSMGDKQSIFLGSNDWIGSFEVCICLDYFYDIPCKIVHVRSGSQLAEHLMEISNHFRDFGSPVMMGGDTDCSSKCILGVCNSPTSLLVMDPHYFGKTPCKGKLQLDGFVKWMTMDMFSKDSFYNLCLPQFKGA